MFSSILDTTTGLTMSHVAICSGTSIILGLVIAFIYMTYGSYTKNFVVTLALLPVLVQIVIMMVNGNLGTSVAILGAFGLVRFRSVPGSSREISNVFLSMAIGLATGMGFITFAIVMTAIVCLVIVLLTRTNFGEQKSGERVLKVTIPENLDYTGIFDDLFQDYTKKATLNSVKTTNLGSLYELNYSIVLKNSAEEKDFIDGIRCRNGNLTIVCGRVANTSDAL